MDFPSLGMALCSLSPCLCQILTFEVSTSLYNENLTVCWANKMNTLMTKDWTLHMPIPINLIPYLSRISGDVEPRLEKLPETCGF